MAQLANLLIPQLTDLSLAEQLSLIRNVRERRRFIAAARLPKPVRAAKKAKDPLAGLSKEQLEKLLEVLTNAT